MRERNITTTAIVTSLCVLILASTSFATKREMSDLNADMEAFLQASKLMNDPVDRFFISEMAVQNIYKQWAIWSRNKHLDESLDHLMGSSYTRFIVLQYHLNSPSWAEWGLIELKTLLPAYKAHIDSTTELSYGEQLHFVEEEWLPRFAECNAFNELVPMKKLIDNPIELEVRQGCYADEEKYILKTAENYLNRRLREKKETFYFYVPPGEYQVADRNSWIFPKEFTASPDTAQFVYLTPNYSFNFIPVAQVFSDEGVYYDTLSPSEFELIRLDEGRIFEFDGLEFGRYQFRVKPPYKLVDTYPNKLIIPKEEFGSNYLDQHSELFDKAAYDRMIVANGENFTYTKVEVVMQPATDEKKKKKD